MSISFYIGSLLYNDDSFKDFESLEKLLLHLIRVIIMSTCDPKALEKGGCELHYCLILGSIFSTRKSCQKVRLKIKKFEIEVIWRVSIARSEGKKGKSPNFLYIFSVFSHKY